MGTHGSYSSPSGPAACRGLDPHGSGAVSQRKKLRHGGCAFAPERRRILPTDDGPGADGGAVHQTHVRAPLTAWARLAAAMLVLLVAASVLVPGARAQAGGGSEISALDSQYLFALCSASQQCAARHWIAGPDTVSALSSAELALYGAMFAEMLPVAMARSPHVSAFLLPQVKECAVEYAAGLGDECASVQALFLAALEDMSACPHPNQSWQLGFGCSCKMSADCDDDLVLVSTSDMRIMWVLPAIAVVFVIGKIVFKEKDLTGVLQAIRVLHQIVTSTQYPA